MRFSAFMEVSCCWKAAMPRWSPHSADAASAPESERGADSCRPKQNGAGVSPLRPRSITRNSGPAEDLLLDVELVVDGLDVVDCAGQFLGRRLRFRVSTKPESCTTPSRVSMLIWCALVRGSPASADFTLVVMAPSSTTCSPLRSVVFTVRLLRTAVTPLVLLATSEARVLARRGVHEAVQLNGALERFDVDLVRLGDRIGDQRRLHAGRGHRIVDLFTRRLGVRVDAQATIARVTTITTALTKPFDFCI